MRESAKAMEQALSRAQAKTYLEDFRRAHAPAAIQYADRDWPYIRAGNGSGQPVVLLHGGGLDAEMWAYQIRELAKTRRVIAPSFDLVPEPFRLRSEVIREILDREGIGEAVLCGHSYGGILAQFFASRFPGRMAGLVLANTFLPAQSFVRRVRRKNLIKHLPAFVIKAGLRRRLADVPGSSWNAYRRAYLEGLYGRVDHRQLILF